jgi:four helix bundle protein
LTQWRNLSEQGSEEVVRDFRELKVWRVGHVLALDVYKVTAIFPRNEEYGLTTQLRRAAVSIGANIAEGSGRPGDPGMRQFLAIAPGSAAEMQDLLALAEDLGYLQPEQRAAPDERVTTLRRMLSVFIRRLSPARPSRR